MTFYEPAGTVLPEYTDCGHPHPERHLLKTGRMYCGDCGARLPGEDTRL